MLRQGAAAANENGAESTTEAGDDQFPEGSPLIKLSAKAAMAQLAKKKKMMAREAFSKKLQRLGVQPSKALDFKK